LYKDKYWIICYNIYSILFFYEGVFCARENTILYYFYIGGAWTILIGTFCMFGALFSKPSTEDYIISMLFYVGTYVVAFLVNLILYEIFKKRLNLRIRSFIIPTIVIWIIGLTYSLLLLI